MIDLEPSRQALLAAALALPRRKWLEAELADAQAADARGYYLPDEDERLRDVYARFLSVRQALKQILEDVRPALKYEKDEEQLKCFVLAFLSATLLLRTGNYLLDTASKSRVLREKLDEAESRYGISRKTFTGIFKAVTDPRSLWAYHEAWRFYDAHKSEISRLESHQEWAPLISLLREEEPLINTQRRDYLKRRLSYRVFSFLRRHHSGYKKTMFSLLKVGGSMVAELRQPGIKAAGDQKRILEHYYDDLISLAQPGDVFITRHDDALSNVFLPGYWPHAALYLGSDEQRQRMGYSRFVEYGESGPSFIESKKDGVKWRAASETLAVDTVLILRPRLEKAEVNTALERAASHIGKLYDFAFDFRQADRLACTAVIYRGYHSAGGQSFKLEDHAGRLALSAENLIDQLLCDFSFEVIAVCGVNGGDCVQGEEALRLLKESYSSKF